MDINVIKQNIHIIIDETYNGKRLSYNRQRVFEDEIGIYLNDFFYSSNPDVKILASEILKVIKISLDTHFQKPVFDRINEEIIAPLSEFIGNPNAKSTGKPTEKTIKETSEIPAYKTLFEYENAFLKLLQDYSDEVKFESVFQAQLRKERLCFFTHTLEDLFKNNERDSQTGEAGVAQWMTVAFVNNYTQHLERSSSLAKLSILKRITEIKAETRRQIYTLSNKVS
ncbi:MAG: hypothetical protein HQK70_12590 [Desulfamplus sp.]|nr:hypothetical protein [Desulfamplus sp.]